MKINIKVKFKNKLIDNMKIFLNFIALRFPLTNVQIIVDNDIIEVYPICFNYLIEDEGIFRDINLLICQHFL